MRQLGLHIPEVRYESAGFSEISPAEPRQPPMLVQVNMENAGVVTQGKLQRSPHCVSIEKASIPLIVFIPVIPEWQVAMSENEDAISAPADLAADKARSLGCEFVGADEISQHVIEHRGGQFEVNIHWSAFRCCAKTSIGRPLAT